MQIIKPTAKGKVIVNYKGKRYEFPTKYSEELANLPPVKLLLTKGLLKVVAEEPKPQPIKEDSPKEVKQDFKPKRGRKPKKED